MKKTRMFVVIALVMAVLVTALPAYASDPTPGEGNTDVIVANMNQNTAAPPATVTALYYTQAGVMVYPRNQQVNSRGSYNFKASDTPLGDNWQGSMVIQSDAELAAVAEILWTGGSSADGTTGDAYTGFPDGSTTMYVPYAVYQPDSQFSVFSVQNTDATAVANIQMTFRNRTGGEDLVRTDTIPAQGSKSFNMRDFPELRQTTFWQTQCSAGPCFWSGAVKIVSTNGKKIAAAVTNHWTTWAAAYSAVSSGATRSYVSSVERRCTDCTWAPPQYGNWQGFSVVTVQCLSATPCEMDMQFVGQTSTMGNLTLPMKTLNPGAAVAASTRAGNDYDKALFSALKDSTDPANQARWAGSVIVSTRNGTEVAVVAYNQRPDVFIAVGFGGAGAANAGLKSFLPAVYKKGVCDGGFSWQKFSIIRIQNPTANNANNVDIYYYNPDGTLAAQELDRTIAAGTALTRHTRVDCTALAGLGNDWTGSVYISSDQPLVAVAESYTNAFNNPSYGASWAAGYNAYSVSP